MPSLKVSIITVVYNRKKTIARAIESVLKQTYQEIEYIIIDGCSTDGTVEILQTYNDGRISKLISEPDGGIYSALNKGLQLATGDVVGFIHSDDFLAHENVVAQLASVFEKDETCDMVYGDLSFFDSENIDKVTRNYSSKFFKTWMMRFALQPAHPTVYARKRVYETVGGFNENYRISADFDWLLRFFWFTKYNFQYLPITMVNMQQGGASTGGLKSMIKHNKEDLEILKSHGIFSNWLFVIAKYLYKIFQLRF